LLDAIWRQRVPWGIELIAIDSGSTDGTVEVLQRRVDRLIQITAAEFNHGTTRNRALESARGDLGVLLVQDAEPVGEDWLAHLVAPLMADDRVAGAFCRQRAREDAGVITRRYLSRYAATRADARVVSLDGPREFETLDALARMDRCTFDNVASVVRLSAWRAHPFAATPIGEDIEWARDVLLAGYRLAYVPDAVVIHSHDRSAAYEFRRARAVHARLRALFDVQTIATRGQLARAIATSMALHGRLTLMTPSAWPHAAAWAIAAPLGQYLGARDADRGTAPKVLGV
jgi:rhamnosyltransferase